MTDAPVAAGQRPALRSLAPDLAAEAFRGLLGREADPAGLAAYAQAIASTGDLAAALHAMAASDEHWARQLMLRPDRLVREAFRGLLGREPDAGALASYAAHLQGGRGLHWLLEVLAGSGEFWQRINHLHRMQGGPADHPISRWAHDAEQVDRMFHRYLARSPTARELADCLHGDGTLGQRLQAFLCSPGGPAAPAGPLPRILLFGAFGNGNIGDAYQALAVRHHLMAAWGLPAECFHACSLLDRDAYPFPTAQKLPAGAILDAQALHRFDLLVIGGGGLLAHPHDPLMSWDWLKKVHIPLVLLAVGASAGLVDSHRDLLERAWCVSGRDQESVLALRRIRADACLLRDPILSCDDAGLLCTDDEQPVDPRPATGGTGAVLWVLKHPVSASDEAFLDHVAEITSQNPDSHRIVAVEPALDSVLEHWFGSRVRHVTRLAPLSAEIAAAGTVVSMRYHGAIFAAMHGRASLGFSQRKIAALYAEAGLAGEYLTDPGQLLPALRHHAGRCSTRPALAPIFASTVRGLGLALRRQPC